MASLDRLTGGLLLAAAASGAGFVLSLFDAKSELLRLSGELVAGLPGRLRGAGRMGRTERLAAANAVVASFFEALRDVHLPFDLDELEITAAEQVAVVTGSAHPCRELASTLVRSSVPMPLPQCPYEDNLVALGRYYDDLAGAVTRFLSGLVVWDRLADGDREALEHAVRRAATTRAVEHYQEMFLRLATEFPEFAFWANLVDHQATRAEIRRLRKALTGLEVGLATMSAGRMPNPARAGLAGRRASKPTR